jgi:hypothetical protein
MDLNHRPSGYEPDDSVFAAQTQSQCGFAAHAPHRLPDCSTLKNNQNTPA